MPARTVTQIVPAMEVSEGAGVTVRRTIGTPPLRNLDPFLMLDHFSTSNPDDYIAGFPDHPHRGFITFTYMIDGHMQHRDSMGNQGDLRAGAAQWMKAASGVIHSEMPQQTAGLMRGFQLWINLPAQEKMSDPAYQELGPASFPVIEGEGFQVKLLTGDFHDRRGPIHDPDTDVQYLDVKLEPELRFTHDLAPGLNAFFYVFEGAVDVAGQHAGTHRLVALGDGDAVELRAGPQGARLILVAGRPLREPVVQYGPFVMSTREEIEQAFADYRAGRLVRAKGTMSGAAP